MASTSPEGSTIASEPETPPRQSVTGGRNANSAAESESVNGRRGCLGACTRETKDNTLELNTDDLVSCLAALDDGRFASGGRGRGDDNWSIIIWSTDGGKEVARLAPPGSVHFLAALDGQRLASGSYFSKIIIWNLELGTHATLESMGGVHCLAALDGGQLASAAGNKSIIIWNLVDGTPRATLEGHTDDVRCLAALDDNQLASGGDFAIRIWNVADGALLDELEGHTSGVLCLAALDGGRLASGDQGGTIIIWNAADSRTLAKLEGHTGAVGCLAALDGNRLASCSNDNSIIIWSVANGCFGFQGEKFTLKNGHHDATIRALAVPSEGRLVSASRDTICVHSLRAAAFNFTLFGRCVRACTGEAPSEHAHGAPLVQSWQSCPTGHGSLVNCLAALDGGRLALGSDDKFVHIFSVVDGTQLTKLEGHMDTVQCLAALDDGRLASGGDRCRKSNHGARTQMIDFHTGGDDSTIIIWNLADYSPVTKLDIWTHAGWRARHCENGPIYSFRRS